MQSIVGFAKNHDYKPGDNIYISHISTLPHLGQSQQRRQRWISFCKNYIKSNFLQKTFQGDKFSVGDRPHAWNAVFLEDSWRLVDPTWGAGGSDMKPTRRSLISFSWFQATTTRPWRSSPSRWTSTTSSPTRTRCNSRTSPSSRSRLTMNILRWNAFCAAGRAWLRSVAACVETDHAGAVQPEAPPLPRLLRAGHGDCWRSAFHTLDSSGPRGAQDQGLGCDQIQGRANSQLKDWHLSQYKLWHVGDKESGELNNYSMCHLEGENRTLAVFTIVLPKTGDYYLK